PKAFSDSNEKVERHSSNSDEDDLFVNTNRCDYPLSSSEEDDEEDEEDDDEAG
ncbi:hypothetical protein AVEN_205367-1, partial [Araneus ventricosus]